MKHKHKALDKDILKSREFRIATIETNLKRGILLASIIIGLEATLVLVDIFTSILKVDERFDSNSYLFMYLLMIAVNTVFLIWAKRIRGLEYIPIPQIGRFECVTVLYITFMLCWGSIVTLMDQKLYGGLAAFMINTLVCLVINNLEKKYIAVPFAASSAILIIGLPFFQNSADKLIGHYINLAIFLTLSWVASRIAFESHYKQLTHTLELSRTKDELEAETKINIRHNAKLKQINSYLKKLSMLDELTQLPNRRSFRYFIDYHFENKKDELKFFSVIMIDVDNFKQLNDQYGHTTGDMILKRIAAQINAGTSIQQDFIARWGGDEFVCASFNRDTEELAALASTIRERILSLNSDEAIPAEITVSIGVCLMEITGTETISKCMESADKAMYTAKASGRNCIQFGP